jgi:PAS domain S-box-containing protein
VNDITLPRAELERLGRAVLGTLSDAVVYADREGVIRLWNPGAERLFGFTAAEAVGRSLDLIIPVPQREKHWAGFRRVMETGESRYDHGDILAVPGLRQNGTRISLEFTIVPVRADDGRMDGMVAILRDVTHRFNELRALRREIATLKAQPVAAASGQGGS